MPFRSVRRKLALGLSAGTLLFGLTMVGFAYTVLRGMLIEQLQEQGVVLAKKLASDAVNPVITGRTFEVAMMFRDLQASDPDVIYAYALDEEGRDLAHTFATGVPAGLKRSHPSNPPPTFSVRRLSTDKGPVLDIGVPMLQGQIGCVHLGFSLVRIRGVVNRIVLLIVLFALLVLLAGFATAFGFARVITRPLVRLAAAAEGFGREGAHGPVVVESEDEIGALARAFNEMVEKRRQVEHEREQLIAELQRTLSEVRTLRGFLPICSSCKKIRRDEGSWQQIESYLREHSEAEFSHGICPDCARRLYPELAARLDKPPQP